MAYECMHFIHIIHLMISCVLCHTQKLAHLHHFRLEVPSLFEQNK